MPFSIFSKFIEHNYTEHCNCWHLMLLSISFYHKRMEIYAVQLTQISECKRKSMIFYKGFIVILPPANEVLGKVIFLQAFVIPSVNGGGLASQHASQVTWSGGLHSGGGCIQGGLHLRPCCRSELCRMYWLAYQWMCSFSNWSIWSKVPIRPVDTDGNEL